MKRGGKWLAAAAAVALPLALLADPHAAFYQDWYNNMWLTGLFGGWMRWHHAPPTLLSTNYLIGIAAPIFYGYLMYPLLGLFAAPFGGQMGLRLGCVAIVALQFHALYLAGRNVFRHRGLAYAFAATLVWSVYSLTNLYNRSAVPEFFATGFLAAATGFLAAAATEPAPRRCRWLLWMAGLCATFAVGSHPPTAVVAAPLLLGLIALALAAWAGGGTPRSAAALGWGLGAAGLGAVALGPWIYAAGRWAREVNLWAAPFPLIHFPERSDNFLGRFGPFPYDVLSLAKGGECSTPYLETPLDFGLWVLLCWLAWRWWRDRAAFAETAGGFPLRLARLVLPAALIWSAAMIVLSLSHVVAEHLPVLGPMLQFGYRLVSHANTGLGLAVLALGLLARRNSPAWERQAAVVAAAVLAIAAVNAGVKLSHGAAVEGEDFNPAFELGTDHSGLITGHPTPTNLEVMYTTPTRLAEISPDQTAGRWASFSVGTAGADFGVVHPVEVRMKAPGWVLTNVGVFPFCRFYANGRRLGADELARIDCRMAVKLPAGATTLRWVDRPTVMWSVLHAAGMIAVLAMIAIAIWLGARGRPF